MIWFGVLITALIAVPVLIWVLWRWDQDNQQLQEAIFKALERRPWQSPLSIVIMLHQYRDEWSLTDIPSSAAVRILLDDMYRDQRVDRTGGVEYYLYAARTPKG